MSGMLKSMGLIGLGMSKPKKEVEVAVCIKDAITWFRVIDNPEPKDVECICSLIKLRRHAGTGMFQSAK